MTKKVLTVFGTRPEAIKMAPVVRAVNNSPNVFTGRVCVTAQHRQMLDQVLDIFDIHVDHDLNIMKPGQDLFDVTCNVLNGMRTIFEREQPDVVLVHGDTSTSMVASLAAYYCQVPTVGHVEAGLRTHNKFSPFPEEINRRITATLADLHFAPTREARQNLLAEGVPSNRIHITGNTVIDALQILQESLTPERSSAICAELIARFPSLLQPLSGSGRKIILVTAHRRENFGRGFEEICKALLEIAERLPDADIIYPVHLNPNIQEPVKTLLGSRQKGNIHLIEPLDYLTFSYLMIRSSIIMTDSGGIQEEAPSLGKPVLLLRETTERPEAVAAGVVKMVGTNRSVIIRETCRLLNDDKAYHAMAIKKNPYGDGKAAMRILGHLQELASRR